MKIFEYIDRVNLLHKLITAKRTGTPDELAKRLNLSKSRLLRVIEDLKLKGAPIVYSRPLKTYQYAHNYKMQINLEFVFLTDNDTKEINGGFVIQNNNFFNAFFEY